MILGSGAIDEDYAGAPGGKRVVQYFDKSRMEINDPDSPDAGTIWFVTNGLLAGGSRGYDHRVDLRVVYQYYCRNLPRRSEPQYPLWQGLPASSRLTPEDVLAQIGPYGEWIGIAQDTGFWGMFGIDAVKAVLVAGGGARSVLTRPLIAEHYGADVRVVEEAGSGLVVVPVRRRP